MNTRPKIPISLKQVEALAAQGLTRKQIAEALGISPATVYDRQRKDEDFKAAIKRGKAKGIVKVSNALFQQAIKGNITAQIFYLKTQAGWKEKDRLDVKQQGSVQINFVDDLKPDDGDEGAST